MQKKNTCVSDEYASRYKGALGLYFRKIEENIFLDKSNLENKTILDLGAGTGRLQHLATLKGTTLIEMDISVGNIQSARDMSCDFGNIYYVCGDAFSIPLKDNTVELILIFGTFQHFNDLSPVLREIKRICAEGARVIFTVWNQERWLNYHLFRLEHRESDHAIADVRQLMAENGINLENYQSTFFMPRRIFWGILKLVPVAIVKKMWILFSLVFESICLFLPFLKRKGYELIVQGRA